MNYKITEQVLNATLTYLASKPYTEVAKLINALQSVQKIIEDPVKEVEKESVKEEPKEDVPKPTKEEPKEDVPKPTKEKKK